MPAWTAPQLAHAIDHTLLKADATASMFSKLCEEATRHTFASVCVPSSQVAFCSEKLAESGIPVCTVIGFPFGYSSTASKLAEAHQAIQEGADELDVVLNLGWLKSGSTIKVESELQAIRSLSSRVLIKVILETAALTDQEKILACRISESAGANCVKTSTGFGPGGATVEDVKLLRANVSDALFVKASGGIRTRETMLEMLNAGATRIGTSAGVTILEGVSDSLHNY